MSRLVCAEIDKGVYEGARDARTQASDGGEGEKATGVGDEANADKICRGGE